MLALDIRAKIVIGLLAVVAGACDLPSLSRLSPHTGHWLTFAMLGAAAAVAQLFPVHTPRNNAFFMSSVFLLPAVFLLPVPLLALLPILVHLPEWLKTRYPWPMELFNVSNDTVDLFAQYLEFIRRMIEYVDRMEDRK